MLNEKGLSDFHALRSASEALPGTGDAVYHLAYEANLEGIVSKQLDSVYGSGPTTIWSKIECFDER